MKKYRILALVPIVMLSFTAAPSHAHALTRVFLTSGSTWSVPSDWNSSDNTVEVIGAGGSNPGGSSTGGGAYAKKTNVTLTPSGSASYQVGVTSPFAPSPNNGDTWFSSTGVVLAKAGSFSGGSAASSVGDVKYSGGNSNGDGGGGAAGPNGAGGNASGSTGGTGGAGSGGAGGAAFSIGGNGTEWDATHGSGGGGGGIIGGAGGLYGGGAGVSSEGGSGEGAQGLIVISYTPGSPAATCTLSANSSSIVPGGQVTLSWTTANATSASIDQGIGSVSTGSGSTNATVTTSVTYTLTVSGAGGGGSCNVSVGTALSKFMLYGGSTTVRGGSTIVR